MQLLEVKNDIAKMIYNPAENHLLPADFVFIEDINQKLIAQILNIETTENSDNNIAYLRLALSIDKEDNLSYYNGYIPSKTAKIIYINPDEILELIKGSDSNIYFGSLSNHSECFVKPPLSFIEDRVYIQSDRDDKTNIIVQNLLFELQSKDKKVILLDFDGRYNAITSAPRLKITENFKLPLNLDAFNTILEYDTKDCPIEDKAVVQSIVLELREYLNSLKDKFIPFTMFKNVVDGEFLSNPVSGLMLLRNKLWLYAQENIFAENKNQFDSINSILENKNLLIIDASSLEEKWYKFIIQTVFKITQRFCYLFISLNDVPIDKKSIINLYSKPEIIPVISTSYENIYRQHLKSVCKNQILCKPSSFINDEQPFNILLNKINTGEFIIFGESTLYLPLVIELLPFDSSIKEEVIQNEIKKDVDKLLSSPKKVIPADTIVPYSIPRPMSMSSHHEPEIEDTSNESDDLTDFDLDFLDEVNSDTAGENQLEEINKNKEKSSKEDNYIVFEPAITKKTDIESIIPENKVPETDFIQSINEDKNEQVVENITETEPDLNIQAEENSNISLEEENTEINSDTNSSNIEEITSIDDLINDITSKLPDETSANSPNEQDMQDIQDMQNMREEAVTQNEPANEDNTHESAELPEVSEIAEDISKDKSDNDDKTKQELVIELEDNDDEKGDNLTPPPVKNNINTKNSPELPVYETDNSSEISIKDIPFKIGDKVFHPKHGKGVIEGFANYSNKILFCQIEFENVGRRILDPRIAGIEKIS